MKFKFVLRRNEEKHLDNVYKQILKRENRHHIAKETHLLNENKSLFKQIESIDKPKKEPSKFEKWYENSWLYDQMQDIKEDLKDSWYMFKYHLRKFRYILLDKLDYVIDHSFYFAIGGLTVVSCLVGVVVYNNMFGYEVTFNGQKIGIVKNVGEFENAMKKVDANLSEWYANPSVFYEKSISYRKVPIKKTNEILNEESCEENIYASKINLFCNGSVITVNGAETVRVASEEQAKTVINNLGQKYETEKSNERLIQEAKVEQDIEYVDKIVSLDSVQPVENAIKYLNGDSNALQNDGGSDARELLNDTDEGRELVSALNFRASDFSTGSAEETRPEITIKTVKEVTYTEDVKYKTEYEDDAEIYVGDEKVKRKGKNGIRKITAVKTYENGKVVSSKIKSKKVVTKPKTRLVARGTKPLPPVTSTGTFLIPASGTVSALNKAGSHAGYRAVDIANHMGTPIYASDTGVVTMVSWYGGYGNCIQIKHENGYSTLYGHNSVMLVHVGQKVEQGEQIAKMGSTGNSTGPHCHFEIRLNGSQQVILNYFTYLRNGNHVSALQ